MFLSKCLSSSSKHFQFYSEDFLFQNMRSVDIFSSKGRQMSFPTLILSSSVMPYSLMTTKYANVFEYSWIISFVSF